MTVSRIEPVSKTRYKVFIDGQFAFALYKGELSRYHIVDGSEIDENVYQILYKDNVKRAKLRAMHLLSDMGRTESQLRTKLLQGGYPQKIVDEAITYVKSFGYINDREYARNFVESRKEKKSRKEIYAALCQKGLDSELIKEALDECYAGEDSLQAIKALLRKKGYHPGNADLKENQKIIGYLVRKGFQYEDIRKVVNLTNVL
ncbi:MAG: regulatory protein RecX [Dorea sp.]|nr:regulatory protein RecX [Dorea sp.]MDY2812647.1 regulatory protein RecX [Dorea sp.]